MTILKDDVFLNQQKLLNASKTSGRPLKRKIFYCNNQEKEKRILLEDMLNGHRTSNNDRCNGETQQPCPVAALSNMGNTCFLNSVLYTLRFAPTFLHNLHHLMDDLNVVNNKLNQNKVKSSSLGRNISSLTGPSSRSTSSKDLLSLGSSNNDVIPKTKVQVVTEKLHELFSTMHNMENVDLKEAYQPNALLSAVQSANSIFQGNHQQDAHELLVYLLDNIRETCELLSQQVKHYPELLVEKEPTTATTTSNNSKFWPLHKSWKKNSKKNFDSIVKDAIINEEKTNGGCVQEGEESESSNGENGRKKLGYNFVCEDFEGVTLRRTKCLECESVTERKEPFYDIPVPINFKEDDIESPNEIYRKACVTSEKLCDTNKYLCDNCKRYNEASREVSFEKLPNIMVLQLKRFMTTLTGVQKVNTYFPTPMELACFCESCCKFQDNGSTHSYHLCCVIMHLGGNLASGHYIAYVRASDTSNDYVDCPHDIPKSSLSASCSEKSINILKSLKYRKTKSLSNSLNDNNKSDVNNKSSAAAIPGCSRLCKSVGCCGVKLNKNVLDNVVNSYTKKNDVMDDVWLECDDETIRPIPGYEFKNLLESKANPTSTPYLLFYTKKTKIPDE